MERNFTVVANRLYKLVKAQDAGNVHLVKQRALRLACLEVDSAFLLDTADFRRAFRVFCTVHGLRGDVFAFNLAAFFAFVDVAVLVLFVGQIFTFRVLARSAAGFFLRLWKVGAPFRFLLLVLLAVDLTACCLDFLGQFLIVGSVPSGTAALAAAADFFA
jgi:hypothetical protein